MDEVGAGPDPLPFADLVPGTPLGPFEVVVSATANERYWRAAGIDHPALAAGALYPPIAANLTVLTFGRTCPDPVIQTRQRLCCHRRAEADTPLVVTGVVNACYEKRGRPYVDVEAVVAVVSAAGNSDPLWTSLVTFTPVAGVGR